MFRSKNWQGTHETLSPDAAPQDESWRDSPQRAETGSPLSTAALFSIEIVTGLHVDLSEP